MDATLATPMTDDDRLEASNGTTITIGADGEVYFEAKAPAIRRPPDKDRFGENLAEVASGGELTSVSTDILDGINADILSRQDFIQNRNKGIDLLGLKLDDASSIRGNRQSISRVKNPSLLRACVRSQSMSRGQLLPAAGPAKVQTISGETAGEDDLAQDFQRDFNYFLTQVDRGYYPDTTRMLFYRAFEGSAYKKIYRDPVLKRPTSRFVSLENLIVSEDASSLADAFRKTHELIYNPMQVKRMQAMGGWLDVELGQPMSNPSIARRKVLESQGLSATPTRQQDVSFTIYETYAYLNLADYGIEDPFATEDMPVPYRITMDRDSRNVLALHRNWHDRDEAFREREVFVKYGLVPGLGFLDYGFLHLIGNQTRVLTAIWQIMVDKGMMANFPGGMKTKGVRTATNELNPALGEWVEVDIGSTDDIRKALMAMPYGDIGEGLIRLAEMLQKDIESFSGTLDLPSGAGNATTPVGTILAMIEQQAQDLTAVQQNDHRAQEEELRLIRQLFIEHPEDLRCLKRKGSERDWGKLIAEFSDMDLVPASDPNIPSQAHRILLNQFLMTIAEKAPALFGSNLQKVASRVMRGVGINDADDLLAPKAEFLKAMQSQQQGKGGGQAQASVAKTQMELPIKQADLALKGQELQIRREENQRHAANEAEDANLRREAHEAETAHAQAELTHDQQVAERDHAIAAAELGQTPQAEADLDKTRASTLASVGTAAMAFAKAGETIAQGERDEHDFLHPPKDEEPQPQQGSSLQQSKPKGKPRAKGKGRS